MNTSGFRIPLATCALLACTAALAVPPTGSVSSTELANALARHRQDLALCNSGQSNQDRPTCLREAEAALMEARRGGLSGGNESYERNALKRCAALPAEQRDACVARMRGEGTTSGSVAAGGLYRELVIPDNTAPAPHP